MQSAQRAGRHLRGRGRRKGPAASVHGHTIRPEDTVQDDERNATANAARAFGMDVPGIEVQELIAASRSHTAVEEVDARGVVAIVRALHAEGLTTVPQLDYPAVMGSKLDRNAISLTALFEGLLPALVAAIGHVIDNLWAKAATVLLLSPLASGIVDGSSRDLDRRNESRAQSCGEFSCSSWHQLLTAYAASSPDDGPAPHRGGSQRRFCSHQLGVQEAGGPPALWTAVGPRSSKRVPGLPRGPGMSGPSSWALLQLG